MQPKWCLHRHNQFATLKITSQDMDNPCGDTSMNSFSWQAQPDTVQTMDTTTLSSSELRFLKTSLFRSNHCFHNLTNSERFHWTFCRTRPPRCLHYWNNSGIVFGITQIIPNLIKNSSLDSCSISIMNQYGLLILCQVAFVAYPLWEFSKV